MERGAMYQEKGARKRSWSLGAGQEMEVGMMSCFGVWDFYHYHEVRTYSGYFEGLVWGSGERWAGDRDFGAIYLQVVFEDIDQGKINQILTE